MEQIPNVNHQIIHKRLKNTQKLKQIIVDNVKINKVVFLRFMFNK